MAEDSPPPAALPSHPRASRLIIVDQGLRQLGGHHAEYSLSVAACAARRMPVIILAHKRCAIGEPDGIRILPNFRFEWTQAQRAVATVDFDPAASFNSRLFLADLRVGLARVAAVIGDHVFIHTIGFDEIEDLLTFVMTSDRTELPTFHILLRRDLDEIGDDGGRRQRFAAYVRAFARLGYWPDLVRFYADTDQLRDHYASETGVAFSTLPIPFNESAAATALATARARAPDRHVIVGYLGSAREEKGYQLLPSVAEALREYLSTGKAKLRLQSTLGEAGMLESRRRLEAFGGGGIELIYRPLSGEEYYRQLAEMDVVLLPYSVERYRRRSSGIFAQAVAAGKIVVVPRGTTMAAWAELFGIASCILYDTASDLPNAVAQAIRECTNLREAARTAGETWLARQPTLTLLDTLLGPPLLPAERGASVAGPRILHIIDGTAAFGQPEAAQRTALRAGVLQRLGCQVLTILAVPSCPTRAELAAWLDRNYRHWFSTDAAFCWLMYLTQPGEESGGVAAELRNVQLLSIPETLPAALDQAGIDLIWTDSLTGLAVADLLGLPGRIPLVYDGREIAAIRHALRRGEMVIAPELIDEFALHRQRHVVASAEMALALHLIPDRNGELALAAFCRPPRPITAPPPGIPLVADILFLLADNEIAAEHCRWFCDAIYAPHLAALGINLTIAATSRTCTPQSRFPQIPRLEAPITSVDEAAAAGRVVVLPLATNADLTVRLVDHVRHLAPFVTLAETPADYAGQLARLVEESLRPAPASAAANYLPAGAADYLTEVENRLRQTIDNKQAE